MSTPERSRLVHPWPFRAPTSKPSHFNTCRTCREVLCFHGHFFFSSFVSCACVYSEHGTAGGPGAVVGRGAVTRSAVAAFVPRHRVCHETRRMHERALFGPPFMTCGRACTSHKGRSGSQRNIYAVLIFATTLTLKKGAVQFEHQRYRPGERRPRWAPGSTRGGRRGWVWHRVIKALPWPNRGGPERGGRHTTLREKFVCSICYLLIFDRA